MSLPWLGKVKETELEFPPEPLPSLPGRDMTRAAAHSGPNSLCSFPAPWPGSFLTHLLTQGACYLINPAWSSPTITKHSLLQSCSLSPKRPHPQAMVSLRCQRGQVDSSPSLLNDFPGYLRTEIMLLQGCLGLNTLPGYFWSLLNTDPLSMTVLRRELEVKAKPLLCCPARA